MCPLTKVLVFFLMNIETGIGKSQTNEKKKIKKYTRFPDLPLGEMVEVVSRIGHF